ncbi:PREDICTED: proline-rich proteoglycan 2-like, partial [Gekko japonicus]|uniref:Proline-rich proteoglycan 2-like n=1 Tax=Gekko japonicus TaxID=146911 RepID=A0ABM1KKM1_GEKJA
MPATPPASWGPKRGPSGTWKGSRVPGCPTRPASLDRPEDPDPRGGWASQAGGGPGGKRASSAGREERAEQEDTSRPPSRPASLPACLPGTGLPPLRGPDLQRQRRRAPTRGLCKGRAPLRIGGEAFGGAGQGSFGAGDRPFLAWSPPEGKESPARFGTPAGSPGASSSAWSAARCASEGLLLPLDPIRTLTPHTPEPRGAPADKYFILNTNQQHTRTSVQRSAVEVPKARETFPPGGCGENQTADLTKDGK